MQVIVISIILCQFLQFYILAPNIEDFNVTLVRGIKSINVSWNKVRGKMQLLLIKNFPLNKIFNNIILDIFRIKNNKEIHVLMVL